MYSCTFSISISPAVFLLKHAGFLLRNSLMELFENAREKTTSPLLLQSYASEFRQGSLHHAKKRAALCITVQDGTLFVFQEVKNRNSFFSLFALFRSFSSCFFFTDVVIVNFDRCAAAFFKRINILRPGLAVAVRFKCRSILDSMVDILD